jgi:hypothetical protein
MFLAILNESYSFVADDMKKHPPDFSNLIAAREKFGATGPVPSRASAHGWDVAGTAAYEME